MFGLGVPELMVILVIALVIFGPSKLPQIGSGLGKAIRDFKKGVTEKDDEESQMPKKTAKICRASRDRQSYSLSSGELHLPPSFADVKFPLD